MQKATNTSKVVERLNRDTMLIA